MRPEQSPLSSLTIELSQLRNGVMQKYGSEGVKVLDTYHADYLFKKQLDDEACMFGDYPTLIQLKTDFDGKFPVAWLMAHLHDLSEYCGCRDKLSGHALQQCASVISTEFGFLKVTEIMLFLHRFKSGRYGRFYGSVDPIVITTSLRTFLRERANEYEEHDRKLKEKADAEYAKTAVTYEEYCRLNGLPVKSSPLSGSNVATPATTKPKAYKRYQEDHMKSMAYSLINNTQRYKPDDLKMLKDLFKDKMGCTPEEYVNKDTK